MKALKSILAVVWLLIGGMLAWYVAKELHTLDIVKAGNEEVTAEGRDLQEVYKGYSFSDVITGSSDDVPNSIVYDDSGNIYVLLGKDERGSFVESKIYKFKPDGVLDNSFGSGGVVKISNSSTGINGINLLDMMYSDGSLVVAGMADIENVILTLDSNGVVGAYTSIAIGADGNPVISYRDVTNSNLKFVHCSSVSCTSGNTIATLDSFGDVGMYTSIAIGADGNPVISYYDATNKDLKFVHCGNASCTGGNTVATLDSSGDVGMHTSVAIGVDGNPVISYYDVTNKDLKFVHCGNASCTSGNTIATLDSSGDVGDYTSIAIGVDGNPVISYRREYYAGRDLKFVHCGNASCSSGNTIMTLDSSGDVGMYTSIAIGVDGNPVISYYDATNNDLKFVHCGNASCSSGNTVTTLDSSGYVGFFTSVAIGADCNPVISYYDATNNDLKFVHCGNASCSSGNTIMTLDSSGDVGMYTSIAIGVNGVPIISYYDNTNFDLKFANVYEPNGQDTGNNMYSVKIDSETGEIDDNFNFVYSNGVNNETYIEKVVDVVDVDDGYVMLGQRFSSVLDNDYAMYVFKVNKDNGKLDTSFGSNGVLAFNAPVDGSDHSHTDAVRLVDVGDGIMAVGRVRDCSSSTTEGLYVVKISYDGNVDNTFGQHVYYGDGIFNEDDDIAGLVKSKDGYIIVLTANIVNYGGVYGKAGIIMKVKDDGSIDNSYGTNGKVILNVGDGTVTELFNIVTDLNSNGYYLVLGRAIDGAEIYPFVYAIDRMGEVVSDFGDNGLVIFKDVTSSGNSRIGVGKDGFTLADGYQDIHLYSAPYSVSRNNDVCNYLVDMDYAVDEVSVSVSEREVDYDVTNMPILGNGVIYFAAYSDSVSYTPSLDQACSNDYITALHWYFAEGYTNRGFKTFLLLQNPTDKTAEVKVSFIRENTSPLVKTYSLQPHSRFTIKAHDLLKEGFGIEVISTNGVNIFAERAMYWGNYDGGHVTIGVTDPKMEWYLAEGWTGGAFKDFILVMNPNDYDINVDVRFLFEDGSVGTNTYTIGARKRYVIKPHDMWKNKGFSTQLTSNDGPFVVERAMYWDNYEGGHDTVGLSELSKEWYLAEGWAGGTFREYILLMNPNDSSVDVTLRFMFEDGSTEDKSYTLLPNSRFTVKAHDLYKGKGFSVKVTASDEIAVERAMYWDNYKGGHDTVGITDISNTWYLAEGWTGGTFREYILLMNPSDNQANVTLKFMFEDGMVINKSYTLLAHSRYTIKAHDLWTGKGFSVEVTSDEKIAVERAMYWDDYDGGHDAVGINVVEE